MFAMKLKEGITLYGNKAMAYGTVGATAVTAGGLTVTNSGVTIESSDLTKVSDANSAYLSSAFQIVELLPYIAVFAGGVYVLNKLFSILPKAG